MAQRRMEIIFHSKCSHLNKKISNNFCSRTSSPTLAIPKILTTLILTALAYIRIINITASFKYNLIEQSREIVYRD